MSIGSVDLGRLGLSPGEGRRSEPSVRLEPVEMSGQRYGFEPAEVAVILDVARMSGSGHSLRLRLEARLSGPCMRCLEAADPVVAVDAREVHQPGGGEELDSPYVGDNVLDVRAWARDAVVLALPAQVLCRDDCRGLCPECGSDLNRAGPEHAHQRPPDPRWAKLRELDRLSGES